MVGRDYNFILDLSIIITIKQMNVYFKVNLSRWKKVTLLSFVLRNHPIRTSAFVLISPNIAFLAKPGNQVSSQVLFYQFLTVKYHD